MGNCCESRASTTDNDAENLIRDSISLLKIRKYDFSDFDEVVEGVIQVSMLDINYTNLHKWVTKEKYEIIIQEHLLNGSNNSALNNSEFFDNQRLSCLIYEDLFISERKSAVVSSNFTSNNSIVSSLTQLPLAQSSSVLYNNFLLWMIAFTRQTTKSKNEKIISIQKIIQKSDSAITFSSFSKFLSRYIQILLYKITQNFLYSNDICNNKFLNSQFFVLKNNLFNKENIEAYITKLLDRCANIIGGYSYNKGVDISNSFMKTNQIKKFFNENSFLLDVIEIRDNFYSSLIDKKEFKD